MSAPEFAKTLPDLKGSLSGDVEIKGELETPSLTLDLQANDVAWQELASLKSLSVKGDVTPLPSPDADLDIVVEGITYEDILIDKVFLGAKGGEEAHTFRYECYLNLFQPN